MRPPLTRDEQLEAREVQRHVADAIAWTTPNPSFPDEINDLLMRAQGANAFAAKKLHEWANAYDH